MYVIKYENKQKEWHPATKPLEFMEFAGAMPTSLLDSSIKPIQNNKMKSASSFTFSPVQLYSTRNWRSRQI
jgi:hypothetical protein